MGTYYKYDVTATQKLVCLSSGFRGDLVNIYHFGVPTTKPMHLQILG